MTTSTDRTATHNGTCQACGRQHAVNVKSGKLAKHGYTVDWGFFNGTVIERRYFADIYDGITADGLTIS